jgi:hypothetical protein
MRIFILSLAFLAGYFVATCTRIHPAHAQSPQNRLKVEIAGRTISTGMTISEIRAAYGEGVNPVRQDGTVQCVDLLTSGTVGGLRTDNIAAGTVYFDRQGRADRIVRYWGFALTEQDLWDKLHNVITGRLSLSGDRAKISIADRNTPDHEVSDLFISFDDGSDIVLERDKRLRAVPPFSEHPISFSVYETFSVNK